MVVTFRKSPNPEEDIMEVSGRIVNVDSEKFKTKLDAFCTRPQKRIIVDISKVDFIDSFGLGALVGFHTQLQKDGRELTILNLNQDKDSYMRKLFEMTSLDIIFKVFDSEEKL